jgi:hypothetical protein
MSAVFDCMPIPLVKLMDRTLRVCEVFDNCLKL